MAYVFKELAIADFNQLINKPIINADLDNTSAATADLTVLYHHVGFSTETYKKAVLYYSNGTAWCEFKGTPGKDGEDGVSVVSAQLTKI